MVLFQKFTKEIADNDTGADKAAWGPAALPNQALAGAGGGALAGATASGDGDPPGEPGAAGGPCHRLSIGFDRNLLVLPDYTSVNEPSRSHICLPKWAGLLHACYTGLYMDLHMALTANPPKTLAQVS